MNVLQLMPEVGLRVEMADRSAGPGTIAAVRFLALRMASLNSDSPVFVSSLTHVHTPSFSLIKFVCCVEERASFSLVHTLGGSFV